MFKSSWGRKGEHKLCSRVHGGVKESTSCVQELKESTSCGSRVHGGVKESTSCVQEFMGALRRAQAVFKSSWGR